MVAAEVYVLNCPWDALWRRKTASGRKMYSANDTIFPSITAAVNLKSHDTSMAVPTILMGMLILGTVVAFSRSSVKKVQRIEEIKMVQTVGQEPPVLESSIPFIGHLIGMLRWQVGYMQMLRYG